VRLNTLVTTVESAAWRAARSSENKQGGIFMKTVLAIFLAAVFMASIALAAGPKDYQVTGPVLELTDDVITVEKDKEKWQIGRSKETKVTGELKKGSKVTIHYKMTATSIESKDPPKAKAKTDVKAK
jgi:hypothetical protein